MPAALGLQGTLVLNETVQFAASPSFTIDLERVFAGSAALIVTAAFQTEPTEVATLQAAALLLQAGSLALTPSFLSVATAALTLDPGGGESILAGAAAFIPAPEVIRHFPTTGLLDAFGSTVGGFEAGAFEPGSFQTGSGSPTDTLNPQWSRLPNAVADLSVANGSATNLSSSGLAGDQWSTPFGPDCEVYVTLQNLPHTVSLYLRLTPTRVEQATLTAEGILVADAAGAGQFTFERVTLRAGSGVLSPQVSWNGYVLSLVGGFQAGAFQPRSFQGDALVIYRSDAGVLTLLQAFPLDLPAATVGDAIGFSAVGTTLGAYYQRAGGAWILIGSVVDTVYPGPGNIGLSLSTLGATVDLFSGGTYGLLIETSVISGAAGFILLAQATDAVTLTAAAAMSALAGQDVLDLTALTGAGQTQTAAAVDTLDQVAVSAASALTAALAQDVADALTLSLSSSLQAAEDVTVAFTAVSAVLITERVDITEQASLTGVGGFTSDGTGGSQAVVETVFLIAGGQKFDLTALSIAVSFAAAVSYDESLTLTAQAGLVLFALAADAIALNSTAALLIIETVAILDLVWLYASAAVGVLTDSVTLVAATASLIVDAPGSDATIQATGTLTAVERLDASTPVPLIIAPVLTQEAGAILVDALSLVGTSVLIGSLITDEAVTLTLTAALLLSPTVDVTDAQLVSVTGLLSAAEGLNTSDALTVNVIGSLQVEPLDQAVLLTALGALLLDAPDSQAVLSLTAALLISAGVGVNEALTLSVTASLQAAAPAFGVINEAVLYGVLGGFALIMDAEEAVGFIGGGALPILSAAEFLALASLTLDVPPDVLVSSDFNVYSENTFVSASADVGMNGFRDSLDSATASGLASFIIGAFPLEVLHTGAVRRSVGVKGKRRVVTPV